MHVRRHKLLLRLVVRSGPTLHRTAVRLVFTVTRTTRSPTQCQIALHTVELNGVEIEKQSLSTQVIIEMPVIARVPVDKPCQYATRLAQLNPPLGVQWC